MILRNIFEEWVQHKGEIFCRLLNASFRVHPAEVNFTFLCLSFLGHVISPSSMSTNWERATVICNFPFLMKVVTRLVNTVDIFSVSKSGTSLNAMGKKNASSIWTQNKVSFRPWIWQISTCLLRDLQFPHWCCSRFKSSGIGCCVAGWVVALTQHSVTSQRT